MERPKSSSQLPRRSGSMKQFEIPHKDASWDLLESWRKATLVLNASRRFRYVANVQKRKDADMQRQRFKATGHAVRAAFRFIDAGIASPGPTASCEDEKAKKLGFGVTPRQLLSLTAAAKIRGFGGVEAVAEKLKLPSLEAGITGDEDDIRTRQEVFGTNAYVEKPPKGFFTFVWEAMHDFTLMILAFCALVSLVIGVITEGWSEGWYDGAGIGFSILLVVFVTAGSDYQQSLQFRALDKEKKNILVQVTRNHRRQKISIFDLVVGDVVHLSIGDQVPGDGVFISGYSLVIDESSMTGESEPQRISEEKPYLLSGTKVQDGSGVMLITGVGMNTEWGHLMAVLGEGGDDETPLQVRLNGVATFIGKVGLGFAVLTFAVLMIRFLINKKDHLTSWGAQDALAIVDYFAIAVTIVVVAVPEGLPLAVTLTLAFAMKKMMRDKALVRHLSACETMGSATCICSDKTGTLTSNRMTVSKAWVCGIVTSDLKHEAVHDRCRQLLLQSCFLNTSGDVADENGKPAELIGTPTEVAVLQYGVNIGGAFKSTRSSFRMVKVEPFNSAKKRMGVMVERQEDSSVRRAFWKGASEIVLGMCDKYLDERGNTCPIDTDKYKEMKGIIKSFADEALRTLCLAYRDVEEGCSTIPEGGFVCIAIVGIKDPVRPGVKEAVQQCFEAGIKVRMVTGDNINTAIAIARECGILTDGQAIEGPEFRRLSQEEMQRLIPDLQVLARSSPTDKHILVKELINLDEVVAVTGDGTNDAPALHEADVGLAMGIAGTEVAKESADVIILDDKFNTIVVVAKWGRSVYTNIQKFVQFQLTVNLVALVLNFTSACITGKAPLTAVQLLWVNLIMDTLGALALATEPPTDDLMKRPPVGRKGSFISNVMWRNILVQVVYQLIVLNVLQYKGKQIFGYSSSLKLNTLIFNAFVFCQVFNEVNAREMDKINVFRNTLSNKVFLLVVFVTVGFQAVLVEFLGKLAATTPLTASEWLISIAIGFVGLPIAALAKLIPVPQEPLCGGSSSGSSEAEEQGYEPLLDSSP